MGAMALTTTPMRDWPQGRCTTADGTSLRWFRSGDRGAGLPPLLFVHGFTDNALYYTRAAEALADRWDVVAYDARGHGASDRAGERFDDEVRVSDLLCIVESLGLQQPAMIGHSMGAATIALALAAHPGVARAAVLEDPAWWEPPVAATDAEAAAQRAARLERNQAWHDWLVALRNGTRAEGIAQRQAESPLWALQDVELSHDARLDVELGLFRFFPQERSEWRRLVPAFSCPVLLVTGDPALGAIITNDQATEATTLNPLVQIAHVDGAGHAIRYDRFDGFLPAVTTFLEAHR